MVFYFTMTDYSISCWWSIIIVALVYLSPKCHLISWFIHCVRWCGTNEISSLKWIYRINWKIYSWSKVSFMSFFVSTDIVCHQIKCMFYTSFFFVAVVAALLCGLSGYIAFIDEFTARDIVQWQVIESGCFEYFDGALPNADNVNTKKLKRAAVLLKDNCSDHMTGLAAATFGLFAKITNRFYADSF